MEKELKLLICISFFNVPEKLKYLKKIIKTFRTYKMTVDIIVDTNTPLEGIDADVIIHDLKHPYSLTYTHRNHFVNNIHKYDWFMYVEDDMDVPWENFKNYMENFYLLYPNYIPSFVRIEEFKGKKFVTDCTEQQELLPIKIGEKNFIALKQPYHAFWIMPKKELKETLTTNFNRLDTHREMAASYPMWELKKIALVQLGENGQVSPLCYSYHLPNNYAEFPNTPFAKIEINQLIK
jgi:hypothetical protein